MDTAGKIVKAFTDHLETPYVRLDDDDGITGYVVSSDFDGMSTLDRQTLIENALANATPPLTQAERRHVLMIAGLTPIEADSLGANIRIHKLRQLGNGAIEVVLHGALSDAEYVRGALRGEKGVMTTNPKPSPSGAGTLMCFRANGTAAKPLSKTRLIQILKKDPYITVMPTAEG